MPDNLLQTGGAGGIGALFGAVLGFFGIKSRLDSLEQSTVKKETCIVVQKSSHDLMDAQNEMLREIRTDIKAILKNGNK